jgi:hypothetical protein
MWFEIILGIWIVSAILVGWFYVSSMRENKKRGDN